MDHEGNYKKIATAVLKGLKGNKAVKIEVGQINKPISELDKKDIQLRKLLVPKQLLEFYDQCDGIHIAWREKTGKKSASMATGEIGLVMFEDTFIIHWKEVLWFDWMDEKNAPEGKAEQYRLAKKLKGFDVMDVLLDKTVIIALLLSEKKSEKGDNATLYYWDNKGIKFPMSLSPADYIIKSLDYYGMLRWQLFYIDFEKIDLKSALYQEIFAKIFGTLLEPMTNFIKDYDRLFPGNDIDFLKKQLKLTQQYGLDAGLIT